MGMVHYWFHSYHVFERNTALQQFGKFFGQRCHFANEGKNHKLVGEPETLMDSDSGSENSVVVVHRPGSSSGSGSSPPIGSSSNISTVNQALPRDLISFVDPEPSDGNVEEPLSTQENTCLSSPNESQQWELLSDGDVVYVPYSSSLFLWECFLHVFVVVIFKTVGTL